MRIRKRAKRSDDGVAMILVVSMCMVMLGLALVVAQSVTRQIGPSSRNEHSYAALAAAEAGVAEYVARLQDKSTYYVDTEDQDCVADVGKPGFNAALCGWVDVPGGASDSYEVTLEGPKGEGRLAVTSHHSTFGSPKLDSAILTGPDGRRYDLLKHQQLPGDGTVRPDTSI